MSISTTLSTKGCEMSGEKTMSKRSLKEMPGQSGNFLECLKECLCTQCLILSYFGFGKDEPRFTVSQNRGQMAHKRDEPGKSCCKCVLQKTMKGVDKAIVAKSFRKWKSSSLRSRTMEKPDEPSQESQGERSLSNCTCEAPRLGQEPMGKKYLIFLFQHHSPYCVSHLFLFSLWQF